MDAGYGEETVDYDDYTEDGRSGPPPPTQLPQCTEDFDEGSGPPPPTQLPQRTEEFDEGSGPPPPTMMRSPGASSRNTVRDHRLQHDGDDTAMLSPCASLKDDTMQSPCASIKDDAMQSPSANDPGSADAPMCSPGGQGRSSMSPVDTFVVLARPPSKRPPSFSSAAKAIHGRSAASAGALQQPTALRDRAKNAVLRVNRDKDKDRHKGHVEDDIEEDNDDDNGPRDEDSSREDDDESEDADDPDDQDKSNADVFDNSGKARRNLKSLPRRVIAGTTADPASAGATPSRATSKAGAAVSGTVRADARAAQITSSTKHLKSTADRSSHSNVPSTAASSTKARRPDDGAADAAKANEPSNDDDDDGDIGAPAVQMALESAFMGFTMLNMPAPDGGFPGLGANFKLDQKQRDSDNEILTKFAGHEKTKTFSTTNRQFAIKVVASRKFFNPESFTTDSKGPVPIVSFTTDAHGNFIIIVNGNHRRWYIIIRFLKNNDLDTVPYDEIVWTKDLLEESFRTGLFIAAVYDEDIIKAHDLHHLMMLSLASNNELVSETDTGATQLWRILDVINAGSIEEGRAAIASALNDYTDDVKWVLGNLYPAVIAPLVQMSCLSVFTANGRSQIQFSPSKLKAYGVSAWPFTSMVWRATCAILTLALRSEDLADWLEAQEDSYFDGCTYPDEGITTRFREAYAETVNWDELEHIRFLPVEKDLVDAILCACEKAMSTMSDLPQFKKHTSVGIWADNNVSRAGLQKEMKAYYNAVAFHLGPDLETLACRLRINATSKGLFVYDVVANLFNKLDPALHYILSLSVPGGHYYLAYAKPNGSSNVCVYSAVSIWLTWMMAMRERSGASYKSPLSDMHRMERAMVKILDYILRNANGLVGGRIETALEAFDLSRAPIFTDQSVNAIAIHVVAFIVIWQNAVMKLEKIPLADVVVSMLPLPSNAVWAAYNMQSQGSTKLPKLSTAQRDSFLRVIKRLLPYWPFEILNNMAGTKSDTSGRTVYFRHIARCLVYLDQKASYILSLCRSFPVLNSIRLYVANILKEPGVLGSAFRPWYTLYNKEAPPADVLPTSSKYRAPLMSPTKDKDAAEAKKKHDKLWAGVKAVHTNMTRTVTALTTKSGKPAAIHVPHTDGKSKTVAQLGFTVGTLFVKTYEALILKVVTENAPADDQVDVILAQVRETYPFSAASLGMATEEEEQEAVEVEDDADGDVAEGQAGSSKQTKKGTSTAAKKKPPQKGKGKGKEKEVVADEATLVDVDEERPRKKRKRASEKD
ncbi:hypothetical protein BD626DRAFT_543560 [Schizophyllum amplum]|uniref:Uncharacterized protein n=1 Tax=Schizophyllum amplum TaxID=97359 RepID=A0A550BRM3_9AGAR|nr:hypothetical protein BD626DRAFT_543560 [Auriculariopsis ampla]